MSPVDEAGVSGQQKERRRLDSSVTWRWKLAVAAEWPNLDTAARRGSTEAEVIRRSIDRPTCLCVRRQRRPSRRQRRRFTYASSAPGSADGPDTCISRFRQPTVVGRSRVIADSSTGGKQCPAAGVRPLFTPTCVSPSRDSFPHHYIAA